jgi:alanyl-tRNA synthetase
MAVLSTDDVRTAFLDFFARNDHTVLPSAPLVPQADPSLLFVNAGMVPFKRVFMGDEVRAYVRAATAQKCVRAGGKHNDLDQVGVTKRHHTFFEMLGNFSFGDYFKEQAIVYAWEFLTGTLALDPKRLWITVYASDDEARALWRKVSGFSNERILSIDGSDNFWSMGDTGPCGPCTEIFYDHGDHLPGGLPGTSDQDGDRFVEIWNLVFMQFDQKADGTRTPLPRPGVDTGIGLERLSAVMQGVDDNYETDTFRVLKRSVCDVLSVAANADTRIPLNVIADHVRAASFVLADGVTPSTEGRGYVLRRIIRRALRYGQRLGADQPFLHALVPAVIETMGGAYPELSKARQLVEKTLLSEETGFAETLARAEGILDDKIRGLAQGQSLSGADAFLLYDTYGLPLDILEELLSEKNLSYDTVGFEVALKAQKERARAHTGFVGVEGGRVYDALLKEHGASTFLGYNATTGAATIQALVKDGHAVHAARAGDRVDIIVDQTPFYGESGGQQGDQGTFEGPEGSGRVLDTQKHQGLILHQVVLDEGSLAVGESVKVDVTVGRRQGLAVHHSATHLLHAALRSVLGDHVTQKGSLVAPDRLRFDFSHFERVTPEDLSAIETLVNANIRRAVPVVTREMSLDDAREAGAMALFGEAYGDRVRVVSMGEADTVEGAASVSTELCGGTHVHNTGALGLFKILGESGVAKGIRRIEAAAGQAAEDYVAGLEATLYDAQKLVGANAGQLIAKIEALLRDKKALQSSVDKEHTGGFSDLIETHHGLSLCVRSAGGTSMPQMRAMVDAWRGASKSPGVMVILGGEDDKIPVVLGVKAMDASADDIFQKLLAPFGGRGGGRRDLAQGGCTTRPEGQALMASLVAIVHPA